MYSVSEHLPLQSPSDVRPDSLADSNRQRHGVVVRTGIASLIAFDFLRQRPQKFTEALALRGHALFYVKPAGFTLGHHLLARSLARHVPAFRQVGNRSYALRPTIFPPFQQHTGKESHNRWLTPLVASQLQRLKLGFLLVLAPEYAPVAQALGIPHAYDHVSGTQFMEQINTTPYAANEKRIRAVTGKVVWVRRGP